VLQKNQVLFFTHCIPVETCRIRPAHMSPYLTICPSTSRLQPLSNDHPDAKYRHTQKLINWKRFRLLTAMFRFKPFHTGTSQIHALLHSLNYSSSKHKAANSAVQTTFWGLLRQFQILATKNYVSSHSILKQSLNLVTENIPQVSKYIYCASYTTLLINCVML
jgi:hypothetical protein